MIGRSSAHLLRRCAAAGVVLLLSVIVTSAYLRLAQAGSGGAGWLACYGAAPSVTDPGRELPWLVPTMRLMHRIAAASVGFVVIAIAALCLSRARRRTGATLIAAALVAFTIFLALLGRATPGAELPAVTLGNLMGGMTMLGLMEWLRLRAAAAPAASWRGARVSWTCGGVVLIALQIALGALVSADYAAPRCPTFPDVHLMHRIGACVLLIYWITLAATDLRSRGNRASPMVMTAVLLIVQFGAGIVTVFSGLPVAVAVAHNTLAALVVLTAVRAAFYSRSADEARVSAACQIVTSK